MARPLRNLALLLWFASPAAALAETRVLALGDSLTAGYGLDAGEGFVPRLQAWLDEAGAGVTVQQGGVSGDTTAGGLARLDWALADGAEALIVALGGNDFLRGVDPAESRSNLRAILETAAERDLPVLLVGIDASGQYGPDYEAAFDAMYPELAAEFGALLEPDWFAPLREAAGSLEAALGTYMQPDGIHPNAAGVDLVVERIGPQVVVLAERAAQ